MASTACLRVSGFLLCRPVLRTSFALGTGGFVCAKQAAVTRIAKANRERRGELARAPLPGSKRVCVMCLRVQVISLRFTKCIGDARGRCAVAVQFKRSWSKARQ